MLSPIGDYRFRLCKYLGLQVYTYRNVLMEHIGETSTFEERNKPGFRMPFPRCGTFMGFRVWNLPREAWYRLRCLGNPEKISPCSFKYNLYFTIDAFFY